MSDAIRIGFAGGQFGKRHLEAFSKITKAQIAAIAEPNASLRQELADTFSIDRQHEDLSDMLFSGDLDAVVIATPSLLHEKHVSQVLDAGLHALCEKPPATNEREMSHIMTTAGLVGKVYMWARQQRFSPELLQARKLVESGEIGEVFHAEGRRQWSWQSFPENDWRTDAEKGGGVLLDIGIHVIDSLWFAMGCPDPVEAMASHFNFRTKEIASDPDDAAEDTSSGMIRFKNGATLQFSATFFSHLPAGEENQWGCPGHFEYKLHGSKALLNLDTAEKSTSQRPNSTTEPYAQKLPEADLFIAQAKEFIAAIIEDREPQNSAKHAHTLMKMLDALKQSAKEKKAVSIKAKRDLDDLFNTL